MSLSRLITLDVGASHIAGAVFEGGDPHRLRLLRFASIPFDAACGGPDRMAEHVKIFLREFAVGEPAGTAAAICIPGQHVLLKIGQTPALENAEQNEAVQFAASQLVPGPVTEVVWDHQLLTNDGVEIDFLFAAAKLEVVRAFCDAAQTARVDLRRIEAGALALRAGFCFTHPEARAGVVVADVGARSTNLLFLDGERFTVRTFALGGNHVSEAVAAALTIEFAEADTLKRAVLSAGPRRNFAAPETAAVLAATADFTRRIQVEITRSSLNHRRRTGAGEPSLLYLTGGGAEWPDLPAKLAERMNLRVERYDPLKNVLVNGDAATAVESIRASLASVVGLAAPLATGGKSEINLLPVELLTRANRWPREHVLLASVFALVILLLPPAGYFQLRAHRLRNEAKQVEAQTMPLRALQSRNAAQVAEIAGLRGQIKGLERMVALKTSWSAFLSDLQARLEEEDDVWLDRLAVLPVSVEDVRSNSEARRGKIAVAPTVRVNVRGRLLDVDQPLAKMGVGATDRVQRLVVSMAGSPFVSAVEREHFESPQSGLLQFDFTLVMKASRPL